MRKVGISQNVENKILNLRTFLLEEWKLSERAAYQRTARINLFLKSLGGVADYSLCRFKKWRDLGYRCAIFEKTWVFAYEILEDGNDIEDNVHYVLSQKMKCDAILTNNRKDFMYFKDIAIISTNLGFIKQRIQ